MTTQPDNPFEVLRLDPSASAEEVVRQAARLRQRATDEETLTAIRRAVQALTGPPEERRRHELLSHPGPCHEWPAPERLRAAFRRPPAVEGAARPDCPPPDLGEVADLLRPVAAEELDPSPLPFEAGPLADPPEEIAAQTAEALWQDLPFRRGGGEGPARS